MFARSFTTAIAGLFVVASTGMAPAHANLISRWTFDEGTGQTVADSADSNPGTLGSSGSADTSDPSFQSTNAPQGTHYLQFDSDRDDFVDMGDPANLNFERSDAFTFAAWVRNPSNGTNEIISRSSIDRPFPGWEWRVENNGVQKFILIHDNKASNLKVTTASGIGDINSVWHELRVTYDGSSDAAGVNFYVDGNPVSKSSPEENNLDGPIHDHATPVNLGTRDEATSSFFSYEGDLDDVRVFSGEAIPEPATLTLLAPAGLLALRRRRS